MDWLLAASRAIDAVNDRFGVLANWLVLTATLISASNATVRYLVGANSNAWFEVQWYMFIGMVLLGAPFTLKMNGHVRIDLFYSWMSERVRLWIDLLGAIFFLLPICIILIYFTWPWFLDSWHLNEHSQNAGGLLRWPVKFLFPLGFGLMALQGASEIIKRIAVLTGGADLQHHYETPVQ